MVQPSTTYPPTQKICLFSIVIKLVCVCVCVCVCGPSNYGAHDKSKSENFESMEVIEQDNWRKSRCQEAKFWVWYLSVLLHIWYLKQAFHIQTRQSSYRSHIDSIKSAWGHTAGSMGLRGLYGNVWELKPVVIPCFNYVQSTKKSIASDYYVIRPVLTPYLTCNTFF